MSHTPGPWTWHDGGGMLWNEPRDIVILNHADCAWDVQPGNASLIAAAPELLGILKDFLAVAALDEWRNATTTLVRHAEAIIAKAEGRS